MDGFLTPNVADVRNPLVVMLHNGCVSATDGGLTPEGESEKFVVNLLEEEPSMPNAARMLEILAENPVAQARFFIISMRLFLEHVLGVMPFDEQLQANGSRASALRGSWGILRWLLPRHSAVARSDRRTSEARLPPAYRVAPHLPSLASPCLAGRNRRSQAFVADVAGEDRTGGGKHHVVLRGHGSLTFRTSSFCCGH